MPFTLLYVRLGGLRVTGCVRAAGIKRQADYEVKDSAGMQITSRQVVPFTLLTAFRPGLSLLCDAVL